MKTKNSSHLRRLKSLIVSSVGVDTDQLTPEADFAADLNTDPLELTDLLTKVEQQFDIQLENKSTITTVGDLIKSLEEALADTL